MSAEERSKWRDEAISLRHREWGFNCPMADIDFLAVEYNAGLPVAIVEYKQKRAQKPDIQHPTYRALKMLANRAGLPFMIVFYCDEIWWFHVYPINHIALKHYPKPVLMTEQEYVTSLYKLRSQCVETNIISKLNNVLEVQSEQAHKTA